MTIKDRKANDGCREIYDSTATLYNITFPWIWRIGFRSLHKKLLLDFKGCDTILDAGTGVGYWLRYLAKKGQFTNVVGVDFSEPYLAYARKRITNLPTAHCEQQNILTMTYADQSFDGALCSGVLDTMPQPEFALREMSRILKPKGKLILILRAKGKISQIVEKPIRRIIHFWLLVFHPKKAQLINKRNIWERKGIAGRIYQMLDGTDLTIIKEHSGLTITYIVLQCQP